MSETVDGEVVVIHLDTGNYDSLRSTGSLIWDAIERGVSVDAITRALDATAHNGTDTNAGVASFVEELRAEDLIVPADSASAPGSGDTVERVPERFEPPVLEKYTDMTHVIQMDPIHDVDVARGWPHERR